MDRQTYLSYYMEFAKEYTGKLNKYGGVPTHLPDQWPVDALGNQMTFLCQLYCDGEMLSIPGTLCIQLYQFVTDGEEGSDPILIQVPIGAKENIEREGVYHEGLIEGDINFRAVREEVTRESAENLKDINGNHLLKSKLGGWCPIETPHFLAMIEDGYEYGSPFCWGCGFTLVLFLNEHHQVEWDFY